MFIDINGMTYNDEYIMNKKLFFYGASTRNKSVIENLNIQDNIIGYIDSNIQKAGKKMDGYLIYQPMILRDNPDCIVISVLIKHAKEVDNSVVQNGCKGCFFYQKGYFDLEMIRVNKDIIYAEKKYKFIHCFPNDKFLIPFYNMINDQFNMREHLFIIDCFLEDIYGINEFIVKNNRENQNIIIIDERNCYSQFVDEETYNNSILSIEQMKKMCETTDKVILHSAFIGDNAIDYIYQLVQNYHEKMAWIAWGGDTYFDAKLFIVKEIIRKVAYKYATATRVDYIKQNYKIEIQATKATYAYIPSIDEWDNGQTKEECCNILLGHSAAEYGNHEYGIKLLSKYQNENVKIFCPLSYGSCTYRDKVIKQGRDCFGDKFIPMLDFMNMDEYYNFLKTIHVAVIPMQRMAAGTTLKYLSAIGKKIYLTKEMIRNFSDSDIMAKDICTIEDASFDQFIQYDCDRQKNIQNVHELNKSVAMEWKKVFED